MGPGIAQVIVSFGIFLLLTVGFLIWGLVVSDRGVVLQSGFLAAWCTFILIAALVATKFGRK